MLNLQFHGTLFAFILLSYILSILMGYILGKRRILSFKWFLKRRKYLADPLVTKLHKWLNKYVMPSIANGKWINVFAIIFLNNLLLSAFITRTLYGLIFILPYCLTTWEGLGQDVGFASFKTKPNLIFFFEFGGYLFATFAGMTLGLSFLLPSQVGNAESFVMEWKDVVYIYLIVIVFLFLGALVETSFVRKFKPPIGLEFDIDEALKKALKALENEETKRLD